MKYIDADLLRKEVKRLEKSAHKSALGCADSETRKFYEGKDFAYQYVGILIDSLQQEQSKRPDFDDVELVHSHYIKVREIKTGKEFWAEYSTESAEWYEAGTGNAYSISDVEIVKEQPDKSLEEAAEEYTQKMLESWRFDSTGCRPPRESFIAGAEWQKQQMMKDAYVESQIVEDGRIELEGDPLPCLNPIILLPYPQFQPGDKVRIIIVKED